MAKVIAADVDPAVSQNRSADEKIVLAAGGTLPFADASFDWVFADFVHRLAPAFFSGNILAGLIRKQVIN